MLLPKRPAGFWVFKISLPSRSLVENVSYMPEATGATEALAKLYF